MSAPVVLDAGARLRRLLAVLAYLAQVGQASLAELALRFSLDEATLVSELELAACCGLPPYTPDQLLELVVDDDSVSAYGLESLHRPPRLTPSEGFVLAAAARGLLAVHGADPDGPLARALAKLEAALGDSRVSIELDHPAVLEPLRRAAANGESVEIDYLGASRGEETTRVVEPYVVAAREGKFYLDAFCHLAEDWRRFALERITAARLTGEHGPVRSLPSEFAGVRAFAGGGSTRVVRIALPASRTMLIERLTTSIEKLDEQRVVAELEIADSRFLGRLLLRLGEEAEVIEPLELQQAAKPIAKAALARYQS